MKTLAELKDWVTEDATWEPKGELHGRSGLDLAGAVIRKAAPILMELEKENTLFKSALIEIERLSQTTCLSFEDQSFDATRIAREALLIK